MDLLKMRKCLHQTILPILRLMNICNLRFIFLVHFAILWCSDPPIHSGKLWCSYLSELSKEV